jgi:hypothetical protein
MTFIKAPCEACQRQLAGELADLPANDELATLDCACLHHNVAIEIGLLSGAVVHWATQNIHGEDDWRRMLVAKQQLQPGMMRAVLDMARLKKSAH